MNNKELQSETEVQQSKTAELLPSAPLMENTMLAGVKVVFNFAWDVRGDLKDFETVLPYCAVPRKGDYINIDNLITDDGTKYFDGDEVCCQVDYVEYTYRNGILLDITLGIRNR